LFNWLIGQGLPVHYERTEEVLFSGIPAEYEALLAEPGKLASLSW
jgi:hypothetical protein